MAGHPANVIRIELGGLLISALDEVEDRVAAQLNALADTFQANAVPKAALREAYQTMGREAQKSVLRSYTQTVRRGPHRSLAPYRQSARRPQNVRYAGGRLKRAIGSDQFFTATAGGLRFINTSVLNKEARHWARLNAGAGNRGRGSRRSFTVRVSGATLPAIGVNMQARPAFRIPHGYWFNAAEGRVVPPGARGTSEFYPMGEGPSKVRKRNVQRRKITAGIEARNFFDAGAATIASMIPTTLIQLYERAFLEGAVPLPKPPRPRRGITSSVTEHRRYGARSHSTRFSNR